MLTKDLKISVYDIECFKAMFLYCCKIRHTGEKISFEISSRKNELDALIKHLKEGDFEFSCGFNNCAYDSQVIQFILDNYQKWIHKTPLEIVQSIYEFSSECIDRRNYELPPVYNEKYLELKQIDLFKIHHYDNKARRVGLKFLEFSMNMPNIEELPIDFRKELLTEEEMQYVADYCWNDVDATEKLLNITIGNTENEIYKGKDKIQDRLDIIEELGFDQRALNYSDVKIGDEINKKGYIQESGVSINQIYEKKRNRKPTTSFTFGNCIPKYVKFKTPEFKALYDRVKDVRVNMNKDKQEFLFTYGNTTYSIMRGGIHSEDKARIIIPGENEVLITADVSSQYPNAINKRGLYPSHLGKEWNIQYGKTTKIRLEYKEKGKVDRKYKGLSENRKLALNGGGFGMLNQKDNWQYDPKAMFYCTIGNQFEILMLIESIELIGCTVISANTDGFEAIVPINLIDEYYKVCNEWENTVGNSEIGKLEFDEYKKFVQTSVNDYIAITKDGKVKLRGDFAIDVELHKNRSNRVVPIALYEYFVNGTPIEETVRNHRNIYDFCIGKKASKDYYYEGIDRNTGAINTYNKLLRYYVSTSGEKLYKVKHKNSNKTGPERSKCESEAPHQKIFNNYFNANKWGDYEIDYQFYISKIYKILDQLESENARNRKERMKGQISMF